MLSYTNIQRDEGILVGVSVTNSGIAAVVAMVVTAGSLHSHKGHARVKDNGII